MVRSSSEKVLYKPSFGVLLRDDLHHAYDRYEWSFYVQVSRMKGLLLVWSLIFPQEGVYYVHIFRPISQLVNSNHGTALVGRDVFRADPMDWPDPVLCSWHYQQCVIAAFRPD